MKSAFKYFQIVLLLCGVFGADQDEVKSVMEGDSVTLNPDLTQIKKFILIEWRFGGPVIAQTDGNNILYPNHTEIFRHRLQLDQTGSLTIKNMKTKHSGLYRLQISHSQGTSYGKFSVTVFESTSDAGKAEMKSMSLIEGNPATLQVDVPQLYGDELIVWRFGDEGKLIARCDIEAKSAPLYYDDRFRDRLELDHQTGSLIITNTRTTDTGVYTVKISSNKQKFYRTYFVAISAAPVSGVSPGALAGIVVVLLVAAAAAAGVIYYFCFKTTEMSVSGMEGENVELNPGTKIQKSDHLEWRFGDQNLIAEKNERGKFTFDDIPDERFRGRLQLNEQTGSLTIKNSRTIDAGLYGLKIMSSRGEKKEYSFIVSVFVDNVSVMEGDDATLTNTKIQQGDQILWMFGDENSPIAEINKENRSITDYANKKFKYLNSDTNTEKNECRLTLNEKNGLTIINARPDDSGRYKLKIISSRGNLCKTFIVTVKVRTVLVMKTSNVTLCTFTEKQRDDKIEWRYQVAAEDFLIAQNTGVETTYDDRSGRFTGKLELHDNTGSLTISNFEQQQNGVYELKISNSKRITYKRFSVTVYDEMKKVLPGGEVTLDPETKEPQNKQLQLQLQFGDKNSSIAQVKGGILRVSKCDVADERFRGRLKMNEKTGSVTISDVRIEHTGLYILQIISCRIKRFKVVIMGVPQSVEKGKSVTLHPSVLIQRGDQFLWMFGGEDCHIAEIMEGTGKISKDADERFTSTLKLDEKTGSLTITNATTEHTGYYKLQISSSRGTSYKIFHITVLDDEDLYVNVNEEETGRRVNESATVVMPLLNKEDEDLANDEEGMSSL